MKYHFLKLVYLIRCAVSGYIVQVMDCEGFAKTHKAASKRDAFAWMRCYDSNYSVLIWHNARGFIVERN